MKTWTTFIRTPCTYDIIWDMTLNVQAVVVIVIIKIIIFTKNYYYVLCRENQERGTFIFCGLYFPNLAGTFTSHSTAAEAASGTNCTFTKFLYASLTRDSSALSPFLCMKTPWHSAKIPRHHFSTQLAMAIPLYHFFFNVTWRDDCWILPACCQTAVSAMMLRLIVIYVRWKHFK